jgi:hypothetical protein
MEEALMEYTPEVRKHLTPDGSMTYQESVDVVLFLHYFMNVVVPYGPIGAELPQLIRTVEGEGRGDHRWFVEMESVQADRHRELGLEFSPTFHWFESPGDAILWCHLLCGLHGIDRVSWINDIAAQILDGSMNPTDRSYCHHKVPKNYRTDMTEKHCQEWIQEDVTPVNGGDGR